MAIATFGQDPSSALSLYRIMEISLGATNPMYRHLFPPSNIRSANLVLLFDLYRDTVICKRVIGLSRSAFFFALDGLRADAKDAAIDANDDVQG